MGNYNSILCNNNNKKMCQVFVDIETYNSDYAKYVEENSDKKIDDSPGYLDLDTLNEPVMSNYLYVTLADGSSKRITKNDYVF